jgi:HSP90 family molecular chaperone
MSALTDEPVPGPVRQIHLSNIDPAEYSNTDALRFYPASDWTDEIPRKFEDFVSKVREILRQTDSDLSISYFNPHDYVILTASGYVTSAQADKIYQAGGKLPVRYMFQGLVYDE